MDLEKELMTIMSNQVTIENTVAHWQTELEQLAIQKSNIEQNIYIINLYSVIKEVINCFQSGSFDFYDIEHLTLYHYYDDDDEEQLIVCFFDSNKKGHIVFGLKYQQQQHFDNFDKMLKALTRIVRTDKFSTYIHNDLLDSDNPITIDVNANMSHQIVEHLLKPDLQKIFNYSLLSSQLNEQSTKSSSKLKI
jgi:hypothetical protein